MDKANPCFKDGQEDSSRIQYKKKTVREKPNQRRMTHEIDNKKSSITAVFILIVFIIQILIMAAALTLAVYSHMKIQTYDGPVEFLTTQTDLISQQMKEMDFRLQAKIEEVRKSLNYQMQLFYTSVVGELNDLQSSVNTLNTTTMDQLSDLQSSVNTLNITTLNELIMIKSTVNSLSTEQTSVTSQVTSLQSSVNNLTLATNNPYQSCIEETRSCTVSQTGYSYYWICSTSMLPINKTVSIE